MSQVLTIKPLVSNKNKVGSFVLLLVSNLIFLPLIIFPFIILANNEHLEMEAMLYMLLAAITVPLGILLSIKLYKYVSKSFQRESLNDVFVIGFSCLFGCLAVLQSNIFASPQSHDRAKDSVLFTTSPTVINESLQKDTADDSSLTYLYNYTILVNNPTKHAYQSALFIDVQLLNPNGIEFKLRTHMENLVLAPGSNSVPIQEHIYMGAQEKRLYDVLKAGILVNPKVQLHIKFTIQELGIYKDYSVPSSLNWLTLTSDPSVILRASQTRKVPEK